MHRARWLPARRGHPAVPDAEHSDISHAIQLEHSRLEATVSCNRIAVPAGASQVFP
jgi:hypothetical protein